MFQIQRLFSSKPPSQNPNNDVIFAQNGRDVHEILFDKGAIAAGTVTVGTLRAAVSKAADVPADSITLVNSGKKLKEDDLTLSSYGVKAGTKVLCMASKTKLSAPGVKRKGKKKGEGSRDASPVKKLLTPMQKIDLTQNFTRDTLLPLVVAFETSPPTDPERKEDEHRRLTETVMGELIKLDGVDVDGEDGVEVRKRRKETVRDMQKILERLDAANRAS